MWKNDYQISQRIEAAFEQRLQQYGFLTENTSHLGVFPAYDISATAVCYNNNVSTYEVKYNANYLNGTFGAGNTIVIEDGRIIDGKFHPSGLISTEADYYVLCFEGDESNFHLIQVNTLKELISKPSNFLETLYDKQNYRIRILRKDVILKYCTQL